MPNPPIATRFPVNRQNHTKKGKYLTPILKKILTGKWAINDPKTKELLASLGLPETIGVYVALRRILNACEGDDNAIERIFDRIDGNINGKNLPEGNGDTKIIIVYPQDYKPREEFGITHKEISSRIS